MRSKNMMLLIVLLAAITMVTNSTYSATSPPWKPLKPDQVLVVANADSPASRDLASFYAAQRGIPKRNIILVKTTEKYLISRKNYQETIHRPIMQAMLERRIDQHIRCICLIWGVPVRISESHSQKKPSSASEIGTYYETQTKDALAKMTVYYELLALVGKAPSKIPPIPHDRIENVADLFDAPLPPPAKKIPTKKALYKK
ncbi:MAG: TIGR03790 family protein, partial [bacterium]|nr:TIGR03790 family protein [bacterium]